MNNTPLKTLLLGNTGLTVTKPAMGCLPLQRCSVEDAVRLLQAAYEGGIRYFDTANAYTDSEKKIGLALSDVRKYIDLFQFHQVAEVPDIDDPEGAFAGALEAKQRGWIRHIGFTSHRVDVAERCIDTGNFETCQFPFSYISDERDSGLPEKCKKAGMGFIAMKGLAGGMLTNARACHAFMEQYDNVVPIWGIQKMEELQEWLAVAKENPSMDEELAEVIRKDRQELAGSFCRSCGYCMPCTVGIEIRNCARMNMLLRRSPWQQYMTDEWYAKMQKINDCVNCRICVSKCPYGLDQPSLLKYMLKDYNEFYESHKHLLFVL